MKAHSFFSRFIRNNKQRQQISVAIFPESLTLAFQADELWVIDTIEATNSVQRVTAIEELIKRNHLVDCQTKIVLGHGLYQSLLIEKPEIPQEEWATALPFLIKDLVNESPMEMVADGFIAPLKERLQVFAASRTVLEPLIKAIRQAGSDVSTISTEEVQWGAFTSGSMSQLILHRRQDAGLHLTAFKRQVMCFQRQLRGVTFPLMGDDASATQVQLQLDGLALELQRSLDFLSAQLRDMPIAQLLISCDGEDDLRLAQELSERLSVKVVAVAPSAVALDSNASRIAWSGFTELPEAVIDLYSEGLKPKTQLLTLPNVAASWVIGAMLIGALAGWHQWQNYVVSQKLAAEQNRLAVKQSEITGLKQRLAEHIPSPLKVELAGNLEQHIAAQQATLKAIEGHDDSLRVGFAGMLRELSDAANGDISLNHIFATGHALDLAGIARSPESVPSWIQAFQSHEHLMDRRFQVMKLGRQEENENVVTFQLQATRSNVSVGASNE